MSMGLQLINYSMATAWLLLRSICEAALTLTQSEATYPAFTWDLSVRIQD